MKRFKALISLNLIIAIYAGLIAPFGLTASAQKVRLATPAANMNNPQNENGLKFRLSEGTQGAENRATTPPAKADALSDAETSGIYKRLPAIKTEKEDQTDFAKRAGSLPPPKTGKKIEQKFPAPEQIQPPNQNLANTLEVVRFSPEGAVNLAPDLNVTFSQAMVAVTSQEQSAQNVPVQVSPALPEGNWRWLGTKTLMFDAKKRFPMATKFTVKIPAGTKSATGQVLQKDVIWNFQTPPPAVETMIPSGQTTRRDALMFISFDQEINAEAVLSKISVFGGTPKLKIRLATQAEIDADSSISYYAKQAQPNRWLAFRAVNADGSTENALPADSLITVAVEKGTPSAEGPLTTEKDQLFSFKTYGAFKFADARCGWNGGVCTPSEPFIFHFTNPLDAKSFTKDLVKIEPAIENPRIYVSGDYLYIEGYKKGRTAYTVTVDGALKDAFDQTLGAAITKTFNVGAAEPNLYAQGGAMVTLDPTAKPSFSIYTTNYATAKMKIYRVAPSDWKQFQEYVRRINYDDKTQKPTIPGKLVADKIVQIENKPDELVETRIDLSEYLDNGFGHLILDIEPPVRKNQNDRTRIFTWVQSTQIGLDAFVDNQELVGFATDLKNGKPLPGVELSIYPNGSRVQSPESRVQSQNTQTWTDWFYSWFASNEKPKGPSAADENGDAVELETIEEAQTNQTGDNGILRLPLPDAQAAQQNVLIARRGKDVSFLPENTDYYWQEKGNWFKKPDINSLRWFVFDDRQMYRQKEEVSVKGYVRVYEGGKFGDIAALGDNASGITYSVKDSRNNEIGKGAATLNNFGAFDFKFKLPDNANLGYSRVELSANSSLTGNTFQHPFQIQEFRRPEFEVTAKNETEPPYLVKSSAMVSVNASYYAGGGLANAEANWTVTSTPTNYTPPNRSDFTFGKWIPWWGNYYNNNYNLTTTQNFKGITDASGKHLLKIDFESANPPRPYNVTASARVQDVNRQTFASSTNLLVHPSDLYIGTKTPRTFVQKGEKITVESIVTDIEGKIIPNRDATIKAVLKDYQFDKGEWKEVVIDEQTCNFKSTNEVSKCEFIAKAGGVYTITARVLDDRERPNETEFTIWVPGGKTPPKRNVEQEQAQIIPDKKEYAPNDVAEILVQSPFENAEGVLTLRREGLVKTERFTMKGSSIVLKIPLEEKYLPNIYAQVDLVGAAARTDDKGEIDAKLAKRPAFASGQINLPISKATRELTVSAEPQDKTLAPASTTKINISVKDNRGEPVANSEVALVVVDESVLALSGYKIGNPLDTFYTMRGAGVTDYHSRRELVLANPQDITYRREQDLPVNGLFKRSGVGRGSGNGSGMATPTVGMPEPISVMREQDAPRKIYKNWVNKDDDYIVTEEEKGRQQVDEKINLRTNFNALALFQPSVKTDSNGRATVDFKLPDNLTRYRIMAVSVDNSGKKFGEGESSITAKQPLMVRPSAPRFMNFGDKIELPVVVQNQTDKPMMVDVAVRATNAELTGDKGKKVVVPANDRVEVRFPVSAVKAGTARFQIGVSSGKFTDAAEIELPVWTPATTEAFATYGTTDQNGAIIQPVEAPKDVFPQFGGLEVTTSSTQLQELTDAFIYLQTYPFECSEQVASRMISIAALQDVLKAFKAKEMPTDAELKARFAKDVEILKSRQND
ncbi:MAG: DUF6049 family protein, partial [Pyrinomonadaceae bacterium]